MTLDGLTLCALVEELDRALAGSRIERVYHPKPDLLTFHAWSPRDRQDRTLLIGTRQPPRFHLTKAQFRNPAQPSSFCMLLRKHLKGSFVQSVEQAGLERVADVRLRRRETDYTLRAELMGHHGTLVLLQPQAERRLVLGAAQLDVRGLRPGHDYEAPTPQDKLDPRAPEAKGAFLSLERSDGKLWGWLLDRLHGVGPRLSKELALRAELDPNAPADALGEAGVARLWDEIAALFGVLPSGGWSPRVYYRDGKPLDPAPFPLRLYAELEYKDYPSLSEAFDVFVETEVFEQQEDTLRNRLLKSVKADVKKAKSALDHVAADLKRAGRYEEIKREADLIMIHLGELEGKSGAVELPDPETGERVTLQLDPRLAPAEAAQKRYARYKKLKRGVDKLEARQAQLRLELEALETAQTQIEQAETLAELNALAQELGLPPERAAERRLDDGDRAASKPRRFEVDGYTVLVGRNSRQNDELVRRGQPDDLWMHARDRPGSHVVIQTGGDPDGVPERVRLRAAQLAAYYSKGRGATKVPVICTRIKHLKKPKGAKPGLVLVTREEGSLLVAPAAEEDR